MGSKNKLKIFFIFAAIAFFLTSCGKKSPIPEGAVLPDYPPPSMVPSELPPQ